MVAKLLILVLTGVVATAFDCSRFSVDLLDDTAAKGAVHSALANSESLDIS